MRTTLRRITTVIPAHNEIDLVEACLNGVQRARARLPPEIATDVVVVVDASSDRTAAVAEHVLDKAGSVVCADLRSVGKARALAAEIAIRRFDAPAEQLWLASTDADTLVPDDWLVRHLAFAERGVVAVAGIIDVVDFTGHGENVAARFRATYERRTDGSHPHVHGANLGIRADAYLRAGGWNALESAEDHDLWARLARIASKDELEADDSLVMVTSGRRIGRAPRGFADALGAHNEK